MDSSKILFCYILCSFCASGSSSKAARTSRQTTVNEINSLSRIRLTCDDYSCNVQGTECRIIEGRPGCVCLSSCPRPQTTSSFVCASNGQTYFNQCLMDKAACIAGVVLREVACPTAPPPATLDTERAPQASTASRSLIVNMGEVLTLHCDVSGSPEPTIQWRKTGISGSLPSSFLQDVTIAEGSATLTIHRASFRHEGEYQCLAFNVHGYALMPFQVTVRAREIAERCQSFSHDQLRLCSHSHSRRRFWIHDATKNICVHKRLPDCGAITNKYHSQAACERSCVDACSLPPKQGHCLRFQSRLHYNPASRTCKVFAFGGCQGNRNNFRNIDECERTCGERPPSVRPKHCPSCDSNLGTLFCDHDFVFAGFLLQSQDPSASYIEARVTAVYKDNGGTLEGVLNSRDPEDAVREFEVSLDERCPCPDLKQLRVDGASINGEVEVILSGNYRYGVPTITQAGLGVLATEVNKNRMKSNKKSDVLCSLLNRLRRQGQS